MSVQSTLPVEQQFATGHQGESLVLMVCQDWLWAGLYTAAPRESLLKVAASASRSVGGIAPLSGPRRHHLRPQPTGRTGRAPLA